MVKIRRGLLPSPLQARIIEVLSKYKGKKLSTSEIGKFLNIDRKGIRTIDYGIYQLLKKGYDIKFDLVMYVNPISKLKGKKRVWYIKED